MLLLPKFLFRNFWCCKIPSECADAAKGKKSQQNLQTGGGSRSLVFTPKLLNTTGADGKVNKEWHFGIIQSLEQQPLA